MAQENLGEGQLNLVNVGAPTAFDCGNAASWQTWKTRFLRYISVTGQSGKTSKEKIDLLIYLMGEEAEDLMLQLSTEQDTFDTVLEKLDKNFLPKKNVIFERFKFNSRVQNECENVDSFITSLHVLANTCEYGILRDELIRDKIVVGLLDKPTSERMQLMERLTLEDATRIARQAEKQREENKVLRQVRPEGEINKMEKRFSKKVTVQKEKSDGDSNDKYQHIKCKYCGRTQRHNWNRCVARKAKCNNCGRVGHFAKACRTKRMNNIDAECEDEHYIGMVWKENNNYKVPVQVFFQAKFLGSLQFRIDTGADVVAVPGSFIGRKIKLFECNENIRGPDGNKLQVRGTLDLSLEYKDKAYVGKVYVVDNLNCPILGIPAIEKMNLIHIMNLVKVKDYVSSISKDFPGIFNELGLFRDEFSIKLVDNPQPFIQAVPRRVPIPLLDKLKQELVRLEQLKVIEPIENPTMFVSPIVIVPKGNSLRICGDYTQVNKNILRPVFPIPKVENTLARLKGARVFSKLDASSGFYQIGLDEKSRELTTIITPFGRYIYKRLPFGLNCAPEYFSMKFMNLFKDLNNVVIHVDDILIFGDNIEEHDKLLNEVLNRINKGGITLNLKKCVFGVQTIEYLGHVITANGVSVNPERILAIKNFKEPENKKELLRFLGMVNFVGRFIPDKSNILQPLNEMLKNNVIFKWDKMQDDAFKKIKEFLLKAPILTHFDPEQKIIVSADSSSYGLGAVLYQENDSKSRKVVAYASRTLNETEKRFSQVEKECLALVWALERFKDYVTGIKVYLETDHKPLIQLLQTKPLDDMTPRLMRFRMRLMRYRYEVVYVPGKNQWVADMLSRKPLEGENTGEELCGDVSKYLRFVVKNLPATDGRLNEIRREQEKDSICMRIKEYTLNGWPKRNKISGDLVFPFRYAFTFAENFLLYNTRLVIPKIMQSSILNGIHTGHFGIVKCRERAKQSVWWLGISRDIETIVKKCIKCTKERKNARESLILEKIPDRAWQRIGIDLCKFNGCWYLVIVDYFSRFIELFKLKALSEVAVINICKTVFARFGIPEVVRTDNGPQFCSKFKHFANEYKFNHITSSPYYSQSNGCAESAVKIVKSLLKKNDDIYLSLLAYRNTPLESGHSPSELMFNRKLREIVPILPSQLMCRKDNCSNYKNRRVEIRSKTKEWYNKKYRVRVLEELKEGDKVWVIDIRKFGKIIKKLTEPRSYLVETESGKFRRNRCHLSKVLYGDVEEERSWIGIEEDKSEVQRPQEVQPVPQNMSTPAHPRRIRRPPVWMKDYL